MPPLPPSVLAALGLAGCAVSPPSAEVDPSARAAATTAGTAETADTADSGELRPCLSIGPCLCGCDDLGPAGGLAPPVAALALVARVRRRREVLEAVGETLPVDVVERLRRRGGD